ncbi:MAG: V-type ATP synthase subunit F [Candidatus Woesearchaeota archaeon]|nr:V-type ATP synthase subunit F [Candidatus Woesearchaeota archaeon]
MAQIAAIGTSEFIGGFQLAGIRKTVEIKKDPMSQIRDLMQDKEMSIVIIDERILNGLESNDKVFIEDCIRPVFVPLSTEAAQENLRRLIKKSIGVDLWKKEG